MDIGQFWNSVDRSGECWIWTLGRKGRGYGQVHLNGHYHSAHRVAWESVNGPIPEGAYVLHHCDNPPCVRPEHLFIGTARDNTRDMIQKGRHPNMSGEAPAGFMALLLTLQGTKSNAEFARDLGVSRSYITHLKKGSRTPTDAFARRVARRHPELAGWYLAQVAQSVTAA